MTDITYIDQAIMAGSCVMGIGVILISTYFFPIPPKGPFIGLAFFIMGFIILGWVGYQKQKPQKEVWE